MTRAAPYPFLRDLCASARKEFYSRRDAEIAEFLESRAAAEME